MKRHRRFHSGVALFVTLLWSTHRAFAAEPMPLSLDAAIDLALQNNLDVAIRVEATRGGEWDIRAEEAAFDPSWHAAAEVSRSEERLFTNQSGDGLDFNRQTRQNLRIDLSQRLPAGGRYSIGLERSRSGARFGSDGVFRTDLVFRLTQPLLRGFGREIVAIPQAAARTGHAILEAEARVEQARIVVAVTEAYWEWVFAREHLAIQRQKRQATEALLAQNRVKVDLGLSAAIEVLVAEAAVASREETVVVAEAAIADAEDRMRSLLNLPQIDIVAVDRPPDLLDDPAPEEKSDADRIAAALTQRPEIARQRLDLHQRLLTLQQADHDRQSSLDFTTALAAGGAGTSDGDAFDRLGSADTPRWEAGLTWTYPIGNRAADARAQKALSEWKVAQLVRKKLERQVADEVRQAARRVRTDRKRVETTRRARALAERKLAAGEERFRLGLIDSRTLLEIQDEAADAADGALRAMTDAQVSRVRLSHAEGVLQPRPKLASP